MEKNVAFKIVESTATGGAWLPRPFGEWRMKSRSLILFSAFVLALAVAFPLAAWAQEAEQPSEGINRGDYNIRQSVELGYRFTNFTGNNDVYDTFVNLGQGPRLLSQSLEMHSLDHRGFLFDDLFMTSFGYGGDPNNLTRLSISKNKWYNFVGSFRRDRNLWNYDLLANPLNPTNSNPSRIVTFSPHAMETTRRMSDFNLTLLPQSKVRFRLGYSHNISEGPSLSTYHSATDTLLFQDWKTTLNAYQFGVDIKLIPHTNISYDQFLQYYKGDTSWMDNSFAYQLSNGVPVDLGLVFNTVASQPCATPIANATTTPPTATATCSGFTAYSRSGPIRSKFPVEQLSFQSNPIQRLDISGRLMYTSSNSDIVNSNEFFQGLGRNRQVQFTTVGPTSAKRVSSSADFSATLTVTNKFRIQDEFRFWNFRIPGQFLMAQSSLFSPTMVTPPNVFDPATCPPPFTAATCPQHTSSSAADLVAEGFSQFLKQNIRLNTIQFLYDFNRRLGARLGYRFRDREIAFSTTQSLAEVFYPTFANRGDCSNEPLNPDGTCTFAETTGPDSDDFKNKESSLLMGFWARPTDSLRITYDMELMYNNHSFTRITPRQLQHYKLRMQYKPSNLVSLSTTGNILQSRDNVATTDHREHAWSYGLDAVISPKDRWSLDFGYELNDIFSQTDVCFAFTGAPSPISTTKCPIIVSGTSGLEGLSVYKNRTHYGFADLMFQPIKRVTFNGGYTLTSTTGNTVILNPNSPAGPLQYNYHTPFANVKVDLYKGVAWKAGWGFYDFNEKDLPGDPLGPRSFRGNMLNLSLVYSF